MYTSTSTSRSADQSTHVTQSDAHEPRRVFSSLMNSGLVKIQLATAGKEALASEERIKGHTQRHPEE